MAYQTGVVIGSGGMGEVYRAWDPELERPVALKYLRASDPELVERLKREARAQARIDHPAVCRVYEVGDDGGRPYIAMQFVDGRQLDVAARGMTLEQKVVVVREVADAVQAAHAVGLIHRDLKPANILVADGEDGRPRPFVLDFGIAREQEVAGLTVTGQVLGTPGYLSPEQARGEVTTLDRRTDVFSLGVILYELLADRRPFLGDSQVEVLMALLEQEPIPLRRLVPRLPRDLETIVMTCLEKAPEQRYPSARALADDLGRFLDGVPVAARRSGLVRRTLARARKNPRTTALLALSLTAVLGLSGLSLWTRWAALRQAQVAQHLGQEVERMVGVAEHAYLLPLHDIRSDAARVRERMASIDAGLSRLPTALQGLGEAAIGRGHLALGEPAAARTRLERAWQLGERSPQTAWALGQAFAELYRQAAEEAIAIRNTELRQAALDRADVELRDPARFFLEQSAGGAEHPAYLAASLAYASHDLDAALAHLAELKHSEPFYYLGDLLAGSIHRLRFEEASRAGDTVAAATEFANAEAAFAAASDVGESDPRPYQQLCGLQVVALRDRYWGSGGDLRPLRDAALAACDKALTADPSSAGAHIEAGRANRYWAANEVQLGRTAPEAVAAARRHAWQALDADPGSATAYVLLGVTHGIAASGLAAHGDDPEEELLAAVAAYREAIRLAPNDHGAHMSLANSQLYLGDHARSQGRDPEPFFTAAVEAASRAVEIAPRIVGGHVNLGIAYGQLAIVARERGRDASSLFASGAAALEQAIELNPAFLTAHFNLGELLVEQAVAELRHGADPTAQVERAVELLEQTAVGYPTWAAPCYLQAEGLALLAEWQRRRDGDPSQLLDRGRASIAAARAVHDTDAVGLSRSSLVHLVAARWASQRNRDPAPAVAAGLAQVDDALAANPGLAAALVRRAELLTVRARWRLAHGSSPTRDLDRAEVALARAAEINASDAGVFAAAASVARLRAEANLGGPGSDPNEAVARGLEAAQRALAIDPSRADAWVERAALHQAAAAAAADPTARRDALDAAAAAAAEALRLDPHSATSLPRQLAMP